MKLGIGFNNEVSDKRDIVESEVGNTGKYIKEFSIF
jgi:hypothetical protein